MTYIKGIKNHAAGAMIRASSKYIQQSATGHIAISDVSGGDFYGYDYAVTVSFWDAATPRQVLLLSRTEWDLGAFYAVFDEDEYEAAIRRGEQMLAEHPPPPENVQFVPGVGPFILAGTRKNV